ncbi:MAG: ComF family protein [Actinobacteria bacterium]|nr:ComF family protein [Actinomycetota bacterium]
MLLDLLLPLRCAVCSRVGEAICAACRALLVRLAPPHCARCGAPGAWPVRRCAECAGRRLAFASARAAILYDERARRFVTEWKERGQRRLAREAAALVAEALARPQVEAIAVVPSDGERTLARGHRPAAALARELGSLWELPVEPLLDRVRRVERQRGLGLKERRRNVAGAFAPRSIPTAPPRRVCLVDDVYTSGATAAAAASALRKGGARHVDVVTFARAVR